ncbi:MAG: mechanosensitive ion channel, partial [Parvularculaceae bacterium]|nr:mechanosensitive ion channel [Parvularculaceae bacterium]
MQTDPVAAPPSETSPGRSALGDLLGDAALETRLRQTVEWLRATLLSVDVATQIVIVLFAILPAALFGPQLQKLVQRVLVARAPQGVLKRAASAVAVIATPVALLIILQAALIVLRALDRPNQILSGGVSLLTAWIVIRLVTLVIRSPFWSKVAFYVAWPVAALDAFGVLSDVLRELDAFAIPIGVNADKTPITFSALDVLRTFIVFAALFALANLAARLAKSRLERIEDLTISAKALLARIIDVLSPVVALVVALQIVGFPFATLAIFGGAVGIGLGLGLGKNVANIFGGLQLIG